MKVNDIISKVKHVRRRNEFQRPTLLDPNTIALGVLSFLGCSCTQLSVTVPTPQPWTLSMLSK